MKTLLSILVILVLSVCTDLNPLLLWEPYRTFVNEVFFSSPRLFYCVLLLALFVGAWLAASDEKQRIAP